MKNKDNLLVIKQCEDWLKMLKLCCRNLKTQRMIFMSAVWKCLLKDKGTSFQPRWCKPCERNKQILGDFIYRTKIRIVILGILFVSARNWGWWKRHRNFVAKNLTSLNGNQTCAIPVGRIPVEKWLKLILTQTPIREYIGEAPQYSKSWSWWDSVLLVL